MGDRDETYPASSTMAPMHPGASLCYVRVKVLWKIEKYSLLEALGWVGKLLGDLSWSSVSPPLNGELHENAVSEQSLGFCVLLHLFTLLFDEFVHTENITYSNIHKSLSSHFLVASPFNYCHILQENFLLFIQTSCSRRSKDLKDDRVSKELRINLFQREQCIFFK